jgi:HK97 family phage major capsid protein
MSRKPAVRALALALGVPWAILPESLETILSIAARVNESPEAIAERMGQKLENTRTVTIRDGVATIPVTGPLFRYADFFTEISGATSYETLSRDFTAALNNPDIRAIVFEIDSPGGEVNGVSELAEMIYQARGKKPIKAYVSGFGASGAYWIAAACDEVIAADTAILGSIGVIATFVDESMAEEDAGIRIINVVSTQSPYKSADPTNAEDLARIQKTVDDLGAVFVGAVAKYRGVSEKTVLAKFGKGDVMVGQGAVDAGLANRLGSYEGEHRTAAPRQSMGLRRAAAAFTLPLADRGSANALTDALSYLSAARSLQLGSWRHAVLPLPAGVTAGVASAPAATSKEHIQMEPIKESPAGANAELAAESERVNQIMALATEHGMLDKASAWISSKATVQAVSREINQSYKEKLKALPAPDGKTEDVSVRGVTEREAKKPWASFGEQLVAVAAAMTPGGKTDMRLLAAATGMNQAVPSEGGFAVAPQFVTSIWDEINNGADSLLAMTDQYTVEGESLSFNANAETSRTTGNRYGGVQGYWINEADQITKSKPKVRELKLEPKELAVLIYATDKLLRNAPALDQYIGRAAPDEINFLVGDAIINGTGVGQPKGMLAAGGSLVTVNKEGSQANGTFLKANANKMWARLHPRLRAGAVWFMNVDVEPTLDDFNTPIKNVAGTENVGGFGTNIYNAEKNTLKGRPIVFIEYCQSLGTVGDVILTNPKAYATGVRAAGLKYETSIHVRFEYAENAFRFMFAVDGQSWLNSAITPAKGTNTLTNIVVLQAR